MKAENESDERLPREIADALDVLGERRNRELLTYLWDTDLYATAHPDGDLERLDDLKTAGLARKQVHSQNDGEIISVYRISNYGERFVEQLLGTLGVEVGESSFASETGGQDG